LSIPSVVTVFEEPAETFTPPPLRYAFSEKKQKIEEIEELSLDLEPSPSFDDILVMLQDDSRLALSKDDDLPSLEDGVKSLQLAAASSIDPPREGEKKVTTALSSYASVDLPQVLPSKEFIIEKIGKDSKRYTSNFAISLETPENYFGYYSEHFYGNGIAFYTC
jgi:hypothetical protein